MRRGLAEAEPSGELEDLTDGHVGEQAHGQDDPADDLMSQSAASRVDASGGRESLSDVLGPDNVLESGQAIQDAAELIGPQGA